MFIYLFGSFQETHIVEGVRNDLQSTSRLCKMLEMRGTGFGAASAEA